MIVWCHEYKDGVGTYSYGIGFPKCRIKDSDITFSRFVGDQDEPFYEIQVSKSIEQRLKA